MSSFIYKCMIITAVIVALYIHESEATTDFLQTILQGILNILQQVVQQLRTFIQNVNNDLGPGINGIGMGLQNAVNAAGTLATNAASESVKNGPASK